MTKKELKFEKRKASLILDCMQEGLFDTVFKEIQSDRYKSIAEVDAYVDTQLRQYDEAVRQITEFYSAKIEGKTLEEDGDDEDEDDDDDEEEI